jgi:hypothetical protein
MSLVYDKYANRKKFQSSIEAAAAFNIGCLVFPKVSFQGGLKKRGGPGEHTLIEMKRSFRNSAETTSELIQ